MRPLKTMTGLVYFWLSRLLLGVGSYFDFVGTSGRLSYADHVRCMIRNHTQIKRGWHVVCCSGFPLHGVHRFESSLLSEMSNRLFVAVIT
jgi:hypothetical protein